MIPVCAVRIAGAIDAEHAGSAAGFRRRKAGKLNCEGVIEALTEGAPGA